jgi:hypothetical protein
MRLAVAVLLTIAVVMGAASIAVGAARTPREIPEGRCELVREWIGPGEPAGHGKILFGYTVCAPATIFTPAKPCRCRQPIAL